MSDNFAKALEEIASNTCTALAIAIDGSIQAVIAMEFIPTFDDLKALTERYRDCVVHLFDRENISPEKLKARIKQSVQALKLAQTQELKPGANLVDKQGRVEWAQDAARRRMKRHPKTP